MANSTSILKERQPWYFKLLRYVDRDERKRVIPLEVLNLSMMRTGSMSMQRALEILGIPTYHMNVVLTRPSDVPLWSEALDAKFYGKGKRYGREEWDKLVGEFGALSDTPVLAFAEDLVEAYPEAKVILVERDPEEWKRSFEGIIKACWDPTTHFIAK